MAANELPRIELHTNQSAIALKAQNRLTDDLIKITEDFSKGLKDFIDFSKKQAKLAQLADEKASKESSGGGGGPKTKPGGGSINESNVFALLGFGSLGAILESSLVLAGGAFIGVINAKIKEAKLLFSVFDDLFPSVRTSWTTTIDNLKTSTVQVFDDIALAVKNSIVNAKNGFVTKFADALLEIQTFPLKAKLTNLFDTSVAKLSTFFDDFVRVMTPSAEGFLGKQITKIVGLIDDIGIRLLLLSDDITNLKTTSLAKLTTNFPKITNLISDIGIGLQMYFDSAVELKNTAISKVSSGVTRAIDFVSDIGTRIGNVAGMIKAPFDTAIDTIKTITGAEGSVGKIVSTFDDIKSYLGTFGSKIAAVAGVAGKVFLPISILMTAYDTITAAIDGFNESGILGGLEGAVTGLFNSVLGMPLDLAKSAVAWVLSKFGFDEAADVLASFSFSEQFSKVIGGVFDLAKSVVGDAISGITGLFKGDFSVENFTKIFGSIFDIIYAPVNLAVNTIKNLFNLGDPDVTFKLSDFIDEVIGNIADFLREKFTNLRGMLPSLDSIKTAIISGLPSWMVPEGMKTTEMRIQDAKRTIAEEQDMMNRSLAGENVYWGSDSAGRAESAENIKKQREVLEKLLEQMEKENQPSIVNVTAVGGSQNSASTTTTYLGSGGSGRPLRPDTM